MASGKVMGIVAWSLAAILAVGLIAVALLGQQQSARATSMGEALVQVASAAGMEGFDTQALPEAAQQVQEAIRATRMELASTKDSLTASQAETAGARTEVGTLTQRVQEQTTRGESLFNELAAAKDALAAAQADAEKAVQEAGVAAQAAEKQKARLEKTIERLKAEMAEETARLQAEIEVLRQPPEPEPEPALEEEFVGEEEAAAAGAEVPLVEEPAAEPEVDLEEGEVIGQSQMFAQIRYQPEERTLSFRLHDGQMLIYQDVPSAVAARLKQAADTLDMAYRFKIQGMYKSLPPDSVVIRKYWKWHRRHKVRDDVRFVEPVVAEAAPEAPAEESPEAPAAEPEAPPEASTE
jgi:ribosomal protein S20